MLEDDTLSLVKYDFAEWQQLPDDERLPLRVLSSTDDRCPAHDMRGCAVNDVLTDSFLDTANWNHMTYSNTSITCDDANGALSLPTSNASSNETELESLATLTDIQNFADCGSADSALLSPASQARTTNVTATSRSDQKGYKKPGRKRKRKTLESKEAKLERNRKSARDFRKRKKEFYAAVQNENAALRQRVSQLEAMLSQNLPPPGTQDKIT